jgi:hypothetical protein
MATSGRLLEGKRPASHVAGGTLAPHTRPAAHHRRSRNIAAQYGSASHLRDLVQLDIGKADVCRRGIMLEDAELSAFSKLAP